MYIISKVCRNPGNGEISQQVLLGPYASKDEVNTSIREDLAQEMERFDLTTECVDSEGNAQPGSYINEGELPLAGIYAYCSYAFDQLLEVVSYVTHDVQGKSEQKPNVKVIIDSGCIDAVLVSKGFELNIEIVNVDKDYDDAEHLEDYREELYRDGSLISSDFTCAHFDCEEYTDK